MPQNNRNYHTKRQLTESLKKLMALKPLNKISIREICECCGVNRQTFYYHFEDIYDQVKWMFRDEIITVLKDFSYSRQWKEGLLILFKYIADNRAVCLCALNSLGHEHMKRFFADDISTIVHNAIIYFSENLPEHVSVEEYENFLIKYYSAAIMGVLENWLLGEIDESPEQMTLYICTIIENQFYGTAARNSSGSAPNPKED
ncbi:MAG: TetR/AcrR family transcriptional regulator C-terminal domain-containing protein [Bacillota bacterium]|nr:TetR/AcrR family transcriptional regulator C-terminal domain-containing protein [Bacillota bacterium]